MTDRHAGYVIVLSENVREDDAEPIMAAIRMIRGVADVRPIIGDPMTIIADVRAKRELTNRLLDALK